MATINWIQSGEPVNGDLSTPSLVEGVSNRPLRDVLRASGVDPNVDFTGFLAGLIIQAAGSPLGNVNTINIIGSTPTVSGGVASITIPTSSGTAGQMALFTSSSVIGDSEWTQITGGHLYPSSGDNLQDIGGANSVARIRTARIGTSIELGSTIPTTGMLRTSKGIILTTLNDAGGDLNVIERRTDASGDLIILSDILTLSKSGNLVQGITDGTVALGTTTSGIGFQSVNAGLIQANAQDPIGLDLLSLSMSCVNPHTGSVYAQIITTGANLRVEMGNVDSLIQFSYITGDFDSINRTYLVPLVDKHLSLGDSTHTIRQLWLSPSATTGASLNIVEGAAPTSPHEGDIWMQSSGLFAYYAGTVNGPFLTSSAGTQGVFINNNGTPLSGSLFTTLNYVSGIVATDAGSNIANLSVSIANANVASGAAIAYSKLALTGSILAADIVASAGIPYSKLTLTGSILNADIVASAGIPYSKLTLTTSIVNGDIATGAAIAYSKLSLTSSIVNADIASAAAIALSKLAGWPSNATGALTNDGSGGLTWASAGSGIAGSGTVGKIPIFVTNTTTIGNSNISDDGTNVVITSRALTPNSTAAALALGGVGKVWAALAVARIGVADDAVDLVIAGDDFGNGKGISFLNHATEYMRIDNNILTIKADAKVATVGKGIYVKEGTNATMGIATLVAGTVVVATSKVTTNSRIFLTNQSVGGTAGFLVVSARTGSTSFTILSSNAADTSVIAWIIIEPA